MTQQQFSSGDNIPAEPAMELLGGDATAASTAGPSLLMKVARGTLFGVVLLGATALLAVSAVPELGRYLAFGGEGSGASCAARGAACTTLDKVKFDSPCCATQSVAATEGASGCCLDAAASEASGLLAADEVAGSCCATLSRAALLKASADKGACCESAGGCCLTAGALAADEPIDAGSLLAASPEQESAEPGSEAGFDNGQAEE